MTVANLLSWLGVLGTSGGPNDQLASSVVLWQGSFGHETDTREAAFVLVLPRPEEGVAYSVFREGALSCKEYFLESSNSDAEPS